MVLSAGAAARHPVAVAGVPAPIRVDRAAALPEAQWSALLGPRDFFLSPPWLRVVEATAGVPIRYLLARDGEALRAALPTALAGPETAWALGRPDAALARCEREGRAGAAEVRAALPGGRPEALLPSLVCGGRHLGRNRILHPTSAGVPVLAEMVAAAERLATEDGAASTAFLYVDEDDAPLRRVLAGRGYNCFDSGEVSALALAPGGFDGYLDTLGAHRRRRIRAERRRCAAAGVRVHIEPLTPALLPRLAELETWLYRKYGLRHWRPEMSERALRGILGEFPGTALVCLARAGGDIRGFGLILPFHDTWYVHRSGFDYAYQGDLPLYFETLFYHPVEAAPGHGVHTLVYGTGSAQTKRSRGCHTSGQRAYVRLLPR
jgi:uncharacterized protein